MEKGKFWKMYFLMSGFMALLCWNTILNLTSYFNHTIWNDIFIDIFWSYSMGGLISMITSPYLMHKYPHHRAILLSTFSLFTCFIVILLTSLKTFESVETKINIINAGMFVLGYFSNIY